MRFNRLIALLFITALVCCIQACKSKKLTSYPGIQLEGDLFYPEDGLIYNQFIGEFIQGYHLANGWRRDSINGGFNKEVYYNPYYTPDNGLEKGQPYFYYKDGKPLNGPHEIEDLSIYGGKSIFACHFVNGIPNGKAIFKTLDGRVLAEGQIEMGELVGTWYAYGNTSRKIEQNTFRKGKRDPVEYIIYDQQEKPQFITRYKSDRVLSESMMYKEGVLIHQIQLLEDHNFDIRKGKAVMALKEYYDFGGLRTEGYILYSHPVLQDSLGTWKFYNETGNLIRTKEF